MTTRRFSLSTAVLLAIGAGYGNAEAASFTVNDTGDGNTPNDAKCTLREALNAANQNINSVDCQNQTGSAGWDTITLPSGTFTAASTLPVNDDVGITGTGSSIIVGPASAHAFLIASSKYGELTSIIIQGGGGAAVWADTNSSVSLFSSTVRNKSFSIGLGQSGGLVAGTGAYVFMSGSTVTNSTGSIKGAAIFSYAGSAIGLEYSTLEANHSSQYGGAVHNQGTMNCFNSTISNNQADISGGGIGNTSGARSDIFNCTITKNTNSGIAVFGGTVTLYSSIVSDQTSGSSCQGTLTSASFNVLGTMTGCTMTPSSDVVNVSASLGALGSNGGPTRTHMPNVGSPALALTPNCPWDDQRFVLRTASMCDAGSVER